MKKFHILLLLSVVLILITNVRPSQAYTFVVDEESGLLTGINGLIVGSDLYNAVFVEGITHELYWTGADWVFDFSDAETATLATQALREAIESVEEYDYSPSSYIYGLNGSSNGTYMFTPYGVELTLSGYGNIYGIAFENQHGSFEIFDNITGWSAGPEDDSTQLDQGYFPWVFVRWEQTSAVPIPGAIWLLGSGMVALGVFRRKRIK